MNKPRGLHGWIRLLEGSPAATLAGLIKELDRVTLSDDSSATELGDLILKDASLTSHIIRIGNSIQFNPSSIPVTTVSRAIINIGFKHIRSVCLGIKVMDLLLADSSSEAVIARLARTMHEAHQTRWLCSGFSVTAQEESFIACLLNNLVELLVLASDTPEAKLLASAYKSAETVSERYTCAEGILGVHVDTLSKTLLRRWRIDGLVLQIYEPGACDERLKLISLGEDIADAVDKGLKSHQFKTVLKRTVKITGKTGVEVKSLIKQGHAETLESLQEFGDPRLLEAAKANSDHIDQTSSNQNLLHTTPKSHKDDSLSAPESMKGEAEVISSAPQNVPLGEAPEPPLEPLPEQQGAATSSGVATNSGLKEEQAERSQVLLDTVHRMSEMLLGDLQINTFFRLLLQGLCDGAGFRRCAFFLFDNANNEFVIKLAQGEDTSHWQAEFKIGRQTNEAQSLQALFDGGVPITVDGSDSSDWQSVLTFTKARDFVIAPLSANGKRVGMIYADMGESGEATPESALKAYEQLYMQARLALTTIAAKKR